MLRIVQNTHNKLILQDSSQPKQLFWLVLFLVQVAAVALIAKPDLIGNGGKYLPPAALFCFIALSWNTSNHVTFDRALGTITHDKKALWWGKRTTFLLSDQPKAVLGEVPNADSSFPSYRPMINDMRGHKKHALTNEETDKNSAEELVSKINRWLAADPI